MPTTLTDSERLILSNQYEILQKLNPDQAKAYADCQRIVQYGYRSLYSELGSFEEELPTEVYREVADVLDMFRILKSSYERLDDKTGIQSHDIEFRGFDGNGSEGHFGLASFMIEDLGRWSEFRASELNSHSYVLPGYRDTLAVSRHAADKHNLSKQEILDIIAAR